MSISYGIPAKFYNEGVSSSKASIKIQLQYGLLPGNILCCDVYGGTESDGRYIDIMDKYTKFKETNFKINKIYKNRYL